MRSSVVRQQPSFEYESITLISRSLAFGDLDFLVVRPYAFKHPWTPNFTHAHEELIRSLYREYRPSFTHNIFAIIGVMGPDYNYGMARQSNFLQY